MPDFEQRLRASLHARAGEVRPDPATWERVQHRIRRRRLLSWAAPAGVVATAAVVALVVVPAFLSGRDEGITLAPGEESAEPEADTSGEDEPAGEGPQVDSLPWLEGRVGGVAWGDGRSVVVQDPRGGQASSGSLVVGTGLTFAPGATIERYLLGAGAVGPDGECHGESLFVHQDDGVSFIGEAVEDCATPPRFSPDGALVARIVRDGDVQRLDFRPPPEDGDRHEPTAVGTVTGAAGQLEVAAWMPDETGREAVYLLDRSDDATALHPVYFDRSESGTGSDEDIAVPAEIDLGEQPEVEAEEGWRIEAIAPRSGSRPLAGELVLLQTAQGQARLWIGQADAEPLHVALPDRLAEAGGRAWVTSEGDHVLTGDGLGRVWYVELVAGGPEVTEVETGWVTAALLPLDGAQEEPDAEDGMDITAFFVRSTDVGLWVEPVTVTLPSPTVGVARAAMEVLVAGPDDGDAGLETLAPEGTRVLGASIDGEVLTVDLSAEVRDAAVGSGGELLFAQQLAHTAAQFDGLEAVRLLVDGQPVTDLWGHVDWSEPIRPDDLHLSPIVIDEVSAADGVVTVTGTATVPEGTVELTLVDPSGNTAEETFTTAECGGPCRGGWTHRFETALDDPGTWVVQASEQRFSDEGRAPFEATAEVDVE